MQVAICDDNKPFLVDIRKKVEMLGMAEEIDAFSNLNAFLFLVEKGKRYDVILMDIEWNGESNGIDVAEELYRLCPKSKIIFMTGHGKLYAQRIFLQRTNLSGFLEKPVEKELLKANLKKVADAMPYVEQSMLVLRWQGIPMSVPTQEIFYIESKGHTITVHWAGDTVTAYDRLDRVLSSLPQGFSKCHKSYVVNMNQIQRFEVSTILLKNGVSIPVSRARYTETKQAYFDFMGQTF